MLLLLHLNLAQLLHLALFLFFCKVAAHYKRHTNQFCKEDFRIRNPFVRISSLRFFWESLNLSRVFILVAFLGLSIRGLWRLPICCFSSIFRSQISWNQTLTLKFPNFRLKLNPEHNSQNTWPFSVIFGSKLHFRKWSFTSFWNHPIPSCRTWDMAIW